MSRLFRFRGVLAPVVIAFAIGGCSSPSAGTSTPTLGVPASQSATGTATAPAPTVTGPASTPAGSKKPTVDLILSGWRSVAAKGSTGTCMLGMKNGVPAVFGFGAVEADYPGLGGGIYISEGTGSSAGYTTIKWIPDPSTGFINSRDIKDAVSDDHRSITVDVDLAGGSAIEHVKGTISCP